MTFADCLRELSELPITGTHHSLPPWEGDIPVNPSQKMRKDLFTKSNLGMDELLALAKKRNKSTLLGAACEEQRV